MKIRTGKFTAAVKAATKSIQNALTPPSSMRGLYARPPPPAILGLRRIPALRVHYDSGTLQKVERPDWENVDEEVLEKVSILKYDITRLRVDAIVNAANSSLLGGGGVDGAIHRAAGSGLRDECRKLDGCEVGEAKITKGYRLPATHIIHTVGPIFDEYRTEEEAAELLRSCYSESLKLAVEKGLKTIAFCSISTGVYGYPIDAATKEAMATTRKFLDSEDGKKIDRVIFCTFSQSDTEVYKQFAPFYFPTSKEYPEQRELPEIPFGAEFPPPSSTATPGEETDEPLTEDEVLVPRTPGRKASTRLKQKNMDEESDEETQAASQAMDTDTQTGADPATVPESQDSQKPETKEESSAEAKATETGDADAQAKEAKEPTLYDTEMVDGVKLEGPSTLPTTVALNVPPPAGTPAEAAAATEADATSAVPEEEAKAKTEAELVKEQELVQANSVPAAGPPAPLPDQETVEEKKADVPNPDASESVEKKEEEAKAEVNKEEVKVEEKKEEVKAEAEKAEEAKTEEKKAEVKAEEAKEEAPKVEEKKEEAKEADKQPEAKVEDVKPEEETKVEEKVEQAKAEDAQAPEAKVDQPKDEGKGEGKKVEDGLAPEPAKAAPPPEAPAAANPDQPTKE